MNNKKYIYFFRKENPFSNFYPCKFKYDGKTFYNSEQAFMYEKARTFNDYTIMNKILTITDPKECKKLGRHVKNYNEYFWDAIREQVMFNVLVCKFKDNPNLWNKLNDTNDSILVEASPYDLIWGVGLSETDSRIKDEKNWKGQNLLGKVLMQVRYKLRKEF